MNKMNCKLDIFFILKLYIFFYSLFEVNFRHEIPQPAPTFITRALAHYFYTFVFSCVDIFKDPPPPVLPKNTSWYKVV